VWEEDEDDEEEDEDDEEEDEDDEEEDDLPIAFGCVEAEPGDHAGCDRGEDGADDHLRDVVADLGCLGRIVVRTRTQGKGYYGEPTKNPEVMNITDMDAVAAKRLMPDWYAETPWLV